MMVKGMTERPAWGVFALGVLAATVLLNGCSYRPRWQVQKGVTSEMVAQALGQPSAGYHEIRPDEVPVLPVRVNLRPCCAFGTHLKASLGPIPVPFFSIGNITSLDALGPHKYDSGAYSVQGSSTKNAFSSEKNGLIYTCRGGFIDTAHVRDYADWTMFWAATIARLSATGGVVEMPPEGGQRRVIIQPIPRDVIDRFGLRRTAVALAQWVSFQLSIWHEIATAYGWSSIELYPEYVSAFSPEDLYSNLLGIKIAGGMLMESGSTATDSLYDQNMDHWLQASLRYLQPVPVDAATTAIYLVDGVWWDSKARLPNPRLVAKRNLDAGTVITPWLISRAYSSPELQAWVDKECGGVEQPLVLERTDEAHGIRFADLVTLVIEPAVKDPFPYPRAGSTEITQADFPDIIAAVRQKMIKALGPGSDQPERDAH